MLPRHGQSRARILIARRWQLLRQLEAFLEPFMLGLSALWLGLLVYELVFGLSRFLADLGLVIWAIFVFDFLLRLLLAPDRWRFVVKNWLSAIALLAPALRMLRIFRLLRAARGLRLIRLLGSFNRGLKVTRAGMRRRGVGFVVALSALVMVLGGAGLFALERGADTPIDSFTQGLWFSSRIVMTVGPDYFPVTPEGRVLSLLLAIYGYAVFGYVTASIASIFIDSDAGNPESRLADEASLRELRDEVRRLRTELAHEKRPAG